jgi:hypothetical protein
MSHIKAIPGLSANLAIISTELGVGICLASGGLERLYRGWGLLPNFLGLLCFLRGSQVL